MSEGHSTETQSPSGTLLGVVTISLLCERGTTNCVTQTELRSAAPGVARSVPLVLGALMFAQRQMRGATDPVRIEAIDAMRAACAESRAGRLAPPAVLPNARTAATYQIEVIANTGFRINLEHKFDAILADSAGALATTKLTAELLLTLPEPYRTFFREMIEAALPAWRERRPLLGESSWNWPVALRRLDVLAREGTESIGESDVCATCQAIRPMGSACLHCGAAPGAPAAPPPQAEAPPAPPPREEVSPSEPPQAPPQFVVAEPAESAPAPEPSAIPYEANIAPAQDLGPGLEAPPPEERLTWPLARLPRRLAAGVVDIIIAMILSSIGSFGATQLVGAAGGFGPGQSAQTFATGVGLLIVALYFVLGWAANETVGMLLFRLRLLRSADRKPGGFLRALVRAVGYVVVLAIGAAIVGAGLYVDNTILFNVRGTADLIIRIIIALIALYVMWSLTGQRMLTGTNRQTLGDQLARTVVAFRRWGRQGGKGAGGVERSGRSTPPAPFPPCLSYLNL